MQLAKTLNVDINHTLLSAVLQQKSNNIIYRAALYLRLSRDDNNGNSESMSIQSQKEMLISYANEHGYEVAGLYIEACDIIEPTQETA